MLILGIDEGEQEVINGADDMGKLECVKQKVFEKAKGKSWAHLKACKMKRSAAFSGFAGGGLLVPTGHSHSSS